MDCTLVANNQALRITIDINLYIDTAAHIAQIIDLHTKYPKLQCIIFEFMYVDTLTIHTAQSMLTIITALTADKLHVILHDFNTIEYQLMASLAPNSQLFQFAATEHEIKLILAQYNIVYSARNILKFGALQYAKYEAKLQRFPNIQDGQHPHTLVLSCCDSRLTPNTFFSANLGEIFVVRNIGNTIPPYSAQARYSEIAALEFALCVLNIRHIAICGHTDCGAIKAASVPSTNLPNSTIDHWLDIIRSSFLHVQDTNHLTLVKQHILQQLTNLCTYNFIQDLLQQQQLEVSFWLYNIADGTILEYINHDFVALDATHNV